MALFISTSACSLYQSEGRKFLEKQGLEYSAAAANLQSCDHEPLGEEWLKVFGTDSAAVFSSESQEFVLRIMPLQANPAFSCMYRFSSVQEMIERTDAAIELTLGQVALGLGGFAFHPISPLK